jgi:serine/threonine-protein kinase
METKRSPSESTADEIIDMLPVMKPKTNFVRAPTTEQAMAIWMARTSRFTARRLYHSVTSAGFCYAGTMAQNDHAFAATVAAEGALDTSQTVREEAVGGSVTYATPGRATTGAGKTAVLPRLSGEKLVHDGRDRYAIKRVLGTGGMGEVALAEDQDIGRSVAVKYLHAPNDGALVARFVEEIHTVGSLEHPNIVPIHDVGIDEQGRYFFVMKHVEGETVENVIEKLAAGDPAYHARYTFTARVELFVAMLRALQFAHARGIVHRDIKPANVMVGKFGEVVLMDWGVAKSAQSTSHAPSPAAPDAAPAPEGRARLFTTRHGSLVGTPAYMSPEQARGDVEHIDARSDLYSACVLFHELLTLHHYMEDRQTLEDMLRAIIAGEGVSVASIASIGKADPGQGSVPAELLYFCERGMRKDPKDRPQSAASMIDELAATLDGRVKVQCPTTLTKRVTRELGRFVDRHPFLGVWVVGGGVLLLLWSVVSTVWLLAR